jgi:hypothetical protein
MGGIMSWLHSGGAFNKEPDNDLGDYPSTFSISGVPSNIPEDNSNMMNNLFRDIMPEEAQHGLVDYRCFYIWNNNIDLAITTPSISLETCDDCDTTILYGSALQNDIQMITITCTGDADELMPDTGGFAIFQCEFGPPFTIYWTSAAQFGSDLQSAFVNIPWCGDVSVTGSNPYTVEFLGQVGTRNVQLIRVVQNDLQNMGVATLDTVTYYASDSWNGVGDSQIQTVEEISDSIPTSGTLSVYNPLTGLWDSIEYNNTDSNNFYLNGPLTFNLVGFLGTQPPYGDLDDPQNWQRSDKSPETNEQLPMPWGVVQAPTTDKVCQIAITKTQKGGPINTYATPILNGFKMPLDVANFTSSPIAFGNLRPNEGFFVWVQRTVPIEADACYQDAFAVQFNANTVAWPLVTGD